MLTKQPQTVFVAIYTALLPCFGKWTENNDGGNSSFISRLLSKTGSCSAS